MPGGVITYTTPPEPESQARSNDAVRRSYERPQLERAWLEGSGGAVYVITPPGTPLPPSPGNW